jgi:hypothetical protein
MPDARKRSDRSLLSKSETMNTEAAIEFVRVHGIVLASAKGPAPRLIDAIAGEAIHGNWWSHPRGSFIYNTLAAVRESDEVLVCRLLGGKITLVHRRLWPALVRVAHRFDPARLAQVSEEHTSNGRHARSELAFPLWVPAEVRETAARLSENQALEELGYAVSGSSVLSSSRKTAASRS